MEAAEKIFVLPTADTASIRRKTLDIVYAPLSDFQKLDVYLPDSGEGPFPVVMAVHGGAWMMCDKSDVQVLPMLRALGRGYAVVAVNYRLSMEAKFPAQIQDVKAAIRWVRANAAAYGFDPARIALWGGSAGAHLSSLAGLTGSDALDPRSPARVFEDPALGNPGLSTFVSAVVAWYGPTDFLKMDPYLAECGLGPQDHSLSDSPESRLLGATITAVPDSVAFANPETYVTGSAPPFFLQHGKKDSTVPHQHSVALARLLTARIGADKVRLELLPDARHADPAFDTAENVARILDFLDRYLK